MPVQRLAHRLLCQIIDQDVPRLVVEVESATTELDQAQSLPKLSADLIALIAQTPRMDWAEGLANAVSVISRLGTMD
jgi:hypothetical protein